MEGLRGYELPTLRKLTLGQQLDLTLALDVLYERYNALDPYEQKQADLKRTQVARRLVVDVIEESEQ